MKSRSRTASIFLLFFGLPFAGVGLFVGSLAYRATAEGEQMRQWQVVTGRLLETELVTSRGDKSTTYRATARYRYVVDGRPYEGERVGLHRGSDNIGAWHADRHRELQQALREGGAIPVYVNPADPSQAVLFPGARRELLWFYALFGGVFALAGLGISTGGVVAFIKSRSSGRLAAAFPAEPWRWRADWAAGRVRSSTRAAAIGLMCFAVFWSVFVSVFLILALQNPRDVPVPAWVVIGLFQCIGLALLAWSVRSLLVAKRYGAAIFHLASVPGVLGGSLAGVVALPSYAEPYESYRVSLACERQVRRGKNTSTETVWSAERELDPAALPARMDGVQVPVLFGLPLDLPPSGHPVTWRLRVRAKQPGVDVDVQFEVPVFRTEASRADFQLDEAPYARYLRATPRAAP
jgi:hypothetical protein